MAKGKIIYIGGPVIRNSHLINAGNKFTPLRDNKGNIQWRVSVINQAQPQRQHDLMDKLLEATLKSTSALNRTVTKTHNTPTK